ncbi:hypothetical protein C8R47DRAFT_1193725 [Mycena vitilis]|nr:hypothetical protein C8R47DRAFT_1193725 [Mycena vitilis]
MRRRPRLFGHCLVRARGAPAISKLGYLLTHVSITPKSHLLLPPSITLARRRCPAHPAGSLGPGIGPADEPYAGGAPALSLGFNGRSSRILGTVRGPLAGAGKASANILTISALLFVPRSPGTYPAVLVALVAPGCLGFDRNWLRRQSGGFLLPALSSPSWDLWRISCSASTPHLTPRVQIAPLAAADPRSGSQDSPALSTLAPSLRPVFPAVVGFVGVHGSRHATCMRLAFYTLYHARRSMVHMPGPYAPNLTSGIALVALDLRYHTGVPCHLNSKRTAMYTKYLLNLMIDPPNTVVESWLNSVHAIPIHSGALTNTNGLTRQAVWFDGLISNFLRRACTF